MRARANRTTFAYADGTSFHAVGTTVYGLLGGVWGRNNANPNKTAESLATLGASPFNKVRMMLCPVHDAAIGGGATWLPYELDPHKVPAQMDPSRFNIPFWKRLDRTISSLMRLGIQADVILFNLCTREHDHVTSHRLGILL